MNKKKKTLPALALAGVMTFSLLSACGAPAENQPSETTPPPVETAAPEPTDTPAPAPTLEPTASPLPEEPVNTPAGDIDVPGQNPPESSAPTAKPQPTKDQGPTPTPVVETEPPAADRTSAVETVWNRIESEVELPASMDMDDEILSALYGIDAANLECYIGKIPLMNVQATELFIAQVKEGAMETVKAGVERRQADLDTQWSSYLPEQLELVQNYKLVTNGNYLLFAISYEADQLVQIFNDCTN